MTFRICPNFLERLGDSFSSPVLMVCLAAGVILAGYLPLFRKAPPERQQAVIRKLLRGGLFLVAFPVVLETIATVALSYTNHCFGKMLAGETGAMLLIGAIMLTASGVLAALRPKAR